VGTGSITRALVTGLCDAAGAPEEIWVSPRNHQISSSLASAFSIVHIGASNQDVLDRTDTIVLAVRPQVAPSIIESLAFRHDHRVISVIAALSYETLLPLVAPASFCVRAAPLPAAALKCGPTAIFPPDAQTARLFGNIGTPIEVENQIHFEALFTCTAEMSSYFQLLDTCMVFLMTKGLPYQSGRQYIAGLFGALSQTTLASSDHTFAELRAEHTTKGGLNEQVNAELTAAGVFSTHASALGHIFARVSGLQGVD
jgi:pyrroline-5-carboxylate reductase